jgi:DNA repair protein RadC
MTPIQRTLFDLHLPTRNFAERPLREWPIGERPIERLSAVGPAAISDAELLAVLFSGSGGANPVVLAQQLISAFGGWHALQRATLEELQQQPGLGRTRAAQVKAALEVARRLSHARPGERLQIRSPADAVQLLMAEMGYLDQEQLRVICLNSKNRVQEVALVYQGSLNTTMVRVSEVFRPAIRLNSAAILVAHNHPSTDPTPSPEDIMVTREIVAAGQLLDIETLDHLVICQGRFVSLRERGLGFTR